MSIKSAKDGRLLLSENFQRKFSQGLESQDVIFTKSGKDARL